jgi:hypothetical protein
MNDISPSLSLCGVAMVILLAIGLGGGRAEGGSQPDAPDKQLPLVFSGGHELGRNDYGRPCALMAAALGVTTEQFRQAFSGVRPARGREPSEEERRRNKDALMSVLAPLGVTNARMDEVANFYRFHPERGELWPHRDAQGYAVMDGGKVTRIVVTDGGFGYNTPPTVTIAELPAVKLEAKLAFDKDMKKNGAIGSVELAK